MKSLPKFKITKKGLLLRVGERSYLNLSKVFKYIVLPIIIITMLVNATSSLINNIDNKAHETINNYIETSEVFESETEPEEDPIYEEPVIEEVAMLVEEPQQEVLDYRLTYYFPGDGCATGTVTSSGKSIYDFDINEYGWYTYKGKLVVATANKALLSWDLYKDSTQKMFKLYDELEITIDGVTYEAIVLDVCGAAMREPRIDLFVKDRASGIDTKIQVVEKQV